MGTFLTVWSRLSAVRASTDLCLKCAERGDLGDLTVVRVDMGLKGGSSLLMRAAGLNAAFRCLSSSSFSALSRSFSFTAFDFFGDGEKGR